MSAPTPVPLNGPLLEREAELSLLFALAHDVSDGATRLGLVTGESGIGKSRLCDEFEASLPDEWMASGGRLTIAEDLHECEPAVIDALLGRGDDVPALVLATCRLEAIAPGSDLARSMLRLLRDRRVVEIRLGPLRGESVMMLAEAAGSGLGTEAAAALIERSGGNPFFALELLRANDRGIPWSVAAAVADRVGAVGGPSLETVAALALWGGPAPDAQLRRVVPDAPVEAMVRADLVVRVDDTVSLRHEIVGEVVLEDLSADARRAHHRAIADVLADAVEVDAVAITAHLEASGDLEAASRIAWQAALRSAEDRYFVRATRLFELSLRESEATRSGAELGEAALAAAAVGRIDLAERWAHAADRAHRAAGEPHRAAELWLDPGLRYVHRPDVHPVDLGPDTASRLAVEAELAVRNGRRDDAVTVARRSLDIALRSRTNDAGAHAARVLLLAGLPGEAATALAALRHDAVVAGEPVVAGRRAHDLNRVAFAVGDLAGAEAHARSAAAAYAQVPEGSEEALMRIGLVATLACMGRLVDAEAVVAPLLDHDDLVVTLMANAPLAIVDIARGDLRSAKDRLATLDPYRDLAGPEAFATVLSDRARVALHEYDLDRARAELDDARTWIGGVFEATLPDRLEIAVRVAVLRNDRAGLLAVVDEATRLARDPAASVGLVALAEWGQGHQALLHERPQVARAQLSSGARRFASAPRLVQSADAWCDAAVASLRLGDHDGVSEALAEAERLARPGGFTFVLDRIAAIVAATDHALPVDDDVARLTPRERSILEHLVSGATNKEIAAELHLSEKTIRNQLSLLFAKLGFERRSQAAAFAARHGLEAMSSPSP